MIFLSRAHWAGLHAHLCAAVMVLSFLAGVSAPFPVSASATLTGFGVSTSTPNNYRPAVPASAATPPSIYNEPAPASDAFSDSVGATPANSRVDEGGSETYSVGLYVATGTASMTPALSLEYNSRGSNGPMGPGWSLGGLSAITRCKKATEFGDGAGPFPSINFDGLATDQAYCLDAARLLDLNAGAGNCPTGQTGDTAHEFGLEIDPSTRVCGYTKPGNSDPTKVVVGYAYWLVSPKDGSYRIYGTGGNSALIHNDGQGNADTQNIQYFSWGLNRIADRTGNTIEFSYTQSTSTGELDIAEIDYTGKIATTDILKASPSFTRSPYASVVFTYGNLPVASQRVDYVSGMKLALTKQLTTITSNGPMNNGSSPNTLQVVRNYHLNYAASTASGLSTLTSLKECVPNGAAEVCYPATNFTWNYLGAHPFGYPGAASTSTDPKLQYAVDYKVGDVDGDGRQDLVWVKDGACDGSGSGSTRFQLMVSLANSTGFAAPLPTGVYINRSGVTGCATDLSSFHFESLWYLYDFSGDGRDDLLASNGTTWNIYPTISVTGGYAFDGAHPVATGMTSSSDDDGIFADFNGDGLPDLIHINSVGGITSNMLQKATSGTLTFQFSSTSTNLYIDTPPGPGGAAVEYDLGFAPRKGRNQLNADLNGDGASDFLLRLTFDNGTCGPGGGNNSTSSVTANGTPYKFEGSSQPDQTEAACPKSWYTFRNQGIQSDGLLHFEYETNVGSIGATGLSGDGSFINLVDLNGDGQADLFYGRFSGSSLTYYYRLNAGKAGDSYTTERFLPEQSTGLTLSSFYAQRIEFIDVNGDHRPDLVYQDGVADGSGTYPLKALLWGASSPTAFGSPVDIGNSTLNAQDPTHAGTYFVDVDGDGGPDIVTVVGTSVKSYGYAARHGGNDFITGIVNGLNAQTYLTYYPLSYAAAYQRAYDGPSKGWGRSSPVFDVFSSIWVVHRSCSSAPIAAANTFANCSGAGGTNALSGVTYHYAGARIQAGGRGFLGFNTVQSENMQATQDSAKYLVTTTEYRQDFPFIGRADHTVVELENALQPDPCQNSPGNSCFTRPDPPCGSGGVRCNVVQTVSASTASIGVGGQVLSDAADTYTSTPAFSAGSAQPLMPYMSGSDEQKFDVITSGALSHEITSSFTDDVYGNVTSASVVTSETAGTTETKNTTNIYGCTVSPPKPSTCITGLNTEWQRLGRLSLTTVTSSRPDQTDATGSKTRRASFEYDSSTLLRVSEIQGPYDDLETNPTVLKTLGMRRDLVRDTDGNVIEEVRCSSYHFATRSACTGLSGFQQQQYPADLTKFQRYAKWQIESLGRFELTKSVPFFSPTSTTGDEEPSEYIGVAITGSSNSISRTRSEQLSSATTFVVNRDAFGNPFNKINATQDYTALSYGFMGRQHFSADTTGGFQLTTFQWCTSAPAADIPSGAPRANCPAGGAYAVIDSNVASGAPYTGQSVSPTIWTYYDVLGREILRTKRIYQSDSPTQSKYHWSSIATTYDAFGRKATVTPPYFSIDPASAQATSVAGALQTGAVATTPKTSTYDAIDRTTDETNPEEAVNAPSTSSWDYSPLTVNATNPRGYITTKVRNARAELISATAPAGQTNALTVNYQHDSVGNATAINRTPSDGDSAGHSISSTILYDRLGRKTSVTDPDRGAWGFSYNALGEETSQTDALGQTQTIYRDALGRMYQRNETRLSGGTYISEPASTWQFDTAKRPGDFNMSLKGTPLYSLLSIESNGIAGFSRTTNYDDIGRVISVQSDLDGTLYTEQQTYDQFGRPYQHFDPNTDPSSADGELTSYSTDGYPITIRESNNGTSGTVYNQVYNLSARGQVEREQRAGNAALETNRDFDDNTGRLLSIVTDANVLQNWSYEYDKHANLTHRINQTTGYNLREDFTYDDLDRLHTVTLTANGMVGPAQTIGYDQLGNLKSKTQSSNTTSWTYGGQPTGCLKAGPHAATLMGTASYCYDSNGNQISANFGSGQSRAITYTGYGLPAQIQTTYPSVSTESFAYAPDRSMWKRTEGVSGASTDNIFCNGFDSTTNSCPPATTAPTTYFAGNVEFRVSGATTSIKRYIGDYLIVATTKTGGSTTAPTYAYLFRDVLGSIDVITNEVAAVQQRQAFDAWGNRRDATASGSWAVFSPTIAAAFDTTRTYQGYTGHQQLDTVGLVHMRGRLYDPVLCRFIQADVTTESDLTQGLNRYSYVLNNPLSLTDPTGYLSFRQILGIAVAVVAACFGQYEISQGALAWGFTISVAGGFLSAYVATGSLKAGLWGAFAAGVFFGLGSYFQNAAWAHDTGVACSSGLTPGAQVASIAAHGAAGGILSDLQYGNFGAGFISAGASAIASPAVEQIKSAPAQILVASAIGGTVSAVAGGKFASGAETAFFSQLFENAARPIEVSQAPLTGKAAAAEKASLDSYQCDDGGMLKDLGIKYEPQDGFSACLTRDSDGQYIFAVRGTDGLNDVVYAWPQSVGVDSSQYRQALALGDLVYKATGGDVLFTGHSAGGGMAAAIAVEVGGDAITFNAQGYLPPPGAGGPGTIVNYYIPGDVLTSSQALLPIPSAMGIQIAYPPSSFFESPLARHSISNFGQ